MWGERFAILQNQASGTRKPIRFISAEVKDEKEFFSTGIVSPCRWTAFVLSQSRDPIPLDVNSIIVRLQHHTCLSTLWEAWCKRGVSPRVKAQEVSCWISTAAARVRSQVKSCRTCYGRSGTETGFIFFFQVLRYLCQFLFHASSGASKMGPLVVSVWNGICLNPPNPTNNNNNNNNNLVEISKTRNIIYTHNC
jgi:hypothetical protein